MRDRSLNWLRSFKSLRPALTEEFQKSSIVDGKLRSAHFLAYDVITALNLSEMTPQLLTTAPLDQTGFSYHVLNSLITARDADSAIQLYQQQLFSSKTSVAARIALLDSLGRMGVEISIQQLRMLNKISPDDLGSAVLAYVREMIIIKKKIRYKELLTDFLSENNIEVKMQCLFIIDELNRKFHIRFLASDLSCDVDAEMEVRQFCKRIKNRTQR